MVCYLFQTFFQLHYDGGDCFVSILLSQIATTYISIRFTSSYGLRFDYYNDLTTILENYLNCRNHLFPTKRRLTQPDVSPF